MDCAPVKFNELLSYQLGELARRGVDPGDGAARKGHCGNRFADHDAAVRSESAEALR